MVSKKITNQTVRTAADKVLVGGVNSPVRSFRYAGVEPLVLSSGRGGRVYDYDGQEYIDFVAGYGAVLLGHGAADIVAAVNTALQEGTVLGATHQREVAFAELLQQAIPLMEKVRCVNSGTEAVMSALRLARGATKRKFVVKFDDSYHGHADALLAGAGSGAATFGIPSSAGVPEEFTQMTLVARRSRAAVEKIIQRYGADIAAVIVEPVGGNWGVIPPDPSFLRWLRKRTKQAGILLIADEIITGFRFGWGSFCVAQGIEPDLLCLGKICGGGLPVGIYGGRAAIMQHLAPEGKVYQGSTFGGNNAVMAAGYAALKALRAKPSLYAQIEKKAGILVAALRAAAPSGMKVSCYGSMFSIKFASQDQFKAFYAGVLKEGVYLAPSEFEANFVSMAHTSADIARTARVFKSNLKGK
jgi:glutamate-1-semialdehyde 2,1-aminomutase